MVGSTEPKKRFIASGVATKYPYLCAVRGGGIWLKMGSVRESSFLLFPVSLCQKNGNGWFDVSADARMHCKIWSCLFPLTNCSADLEPVLLGRPLTVCSHRRTAGVGDFAFGGKRGVCVCVQRRCICALQNVQQPAADDSLIWCGSSIWKRKLLVAERFPVG